MGVGKIWRAKLLVEQLGPQAIGIQWYTIGQWTLARLKNMEVSATLWRQDIEGLKELNNGSSVAVMSA